MARITEVDLAINRVLGTSIGPPPAAKKPEKRRADVRLAEMLAATTYATSPARARTGEPGAVLGRDGYLAEGATYADLVEWVSSQTLFEDAGFEVGLVELADDYSAQLEEQAMIVEAEDKPSERTPDPDDLPGQTGPGVKTPEELSVPFNEEERGKPDDEDSENEPDDGDDMPEGDEDKKTEVEEATTTAGVTAFPTEATDGRHTYQMRRDEERKRMRSQLQELWDGATLEEMCSKHKTSKLPKGVLARVYYKKASQYDKMNRNQRVYESKYARGAIKELDEMAKAGRAFVLEAHPPKDSKSRPQASGAKTVAGLIRLAEYHEESRAAGVVFDIINTSSGRDAAAIVEAGGDLPLSSRAKGATRITTYYEGVDGPIGKRPGRYGVRELIESRQARPITVVGPYRYDGYDIVAGRQSDPGAVTDHIIREAEEDASTGSIEMNLTEFKEAHPDAYAEFVQEAALAAKRAVLEELNVAAETETDVQEAIELIGQTMDQQEALLEALEERDARIADLTEGEEDIEEAEDPRLAEANRRIAELEARNHAHEMGVLFESLCENSPASPYEKFMRPLVLGSTPKSDAAARDLFEQAESLILGIASEARRIARKGATPVAVGIGRGERREQRTQHLNEVAAPSGEALGDIEEADAYDGFNPGL